MAGSPPPTAPQRLTLNTPQRFYAGGERILHWRGVPRPADFDGHRPEDWLGSTTRLFAEGGGGLTRLADGSTLADQLATDPQAWLGPTHRTGYGDDPGLLVKLLDAAERLPVHSHPDRSFAVRHLDCAHGKTEAWLVLDAEPDAVVWLGFRDGVSTDMLASMVARQDEQLLRHLNEIPVRRGDAILVPAGQPHAIGGGVFLLELQEPTDFSVMLEHARFDLDPDHAWLGLGRELALQSVASEALTLDQIEQLRARWDEGDSPLRPGLPDTATPFFRAEVLDPRRGPTTGTAGFSVLVVVAGRGSLRTGSGEELAVQQGETWLTPYSCGDLTLTGDAVALRCRPGTSDVAAAHPEVPHSNINRVEAAS